MAKLPDITALGERPEPSPLSGVSSLRAPNTGAYEAQGAALAEGGRHLAQVSNLFTEMQQQADTLRADDAYNTLRQKQIELSVGENGFMNRKGGDAVNAPIFQDYNKLLEDQIAQINGQLQNPQQKELFRRRADVSRMQFGEHILNHVTQERGNYAVQVFNGTEASELNAIAASAANPLDVQHSIETMVNQAKQRARITGEDPAPLINQVRDKAQLARFGAWMYQDPGAAMAAFKEVAADPTSMSPAVRQKIEIELKQRAFPIQVKNSALGVFNRAIGPDPETQIQKSVAPQATAGGFNAAVSLVLQKEGGYVAKDGKSGAPANFGINQAANPDINVKNLTKDQAVQIYKTRYWDQINGDTLPPATAAVALDTAVLQGPEVANKLVAATGGDPQAMITARRAQLNALADSGPVQAKYRNTWMKRLDTLQGEVANIAPTNPADTAGMLPKLIAEAEKTAQREAPNDPIYRDGLMTEVKSKYNLILEAQRGQLKQAHSQLVLAGRAPPGQQGPTTIGELVNTPALQQAWNMISQDGDSVRGIYAMLEHNSKQETSTRASRELTKEAMRRINLPEGDPNRINDSTQLTALMDKGLIRTDLTWLEGRIDRRDSLSGRTFTKDLDTVVKNADHTFDQLTTLNFLDPVVTGDAKYRFMVDLHNKVDEFQKAGKDPRLLITPGSKDDMRTPERLRSYLERPVDVMAASAKEIAAGKLPTIPKGLTPLQGKDWMDKLPPNVTQVIDARDPKNPRIRNIPNRGDILRPPATQQQVERMIQSVPVPVPGPELQGGR